MKQFLDYIPLIIFFIVYKMEERVVQLGSWSYTLGGIFSATEILVLSSVIVYGSLFLINKRLERTQIITLVAVLIFCTFTIVFRQEAILKWKAPVVNWIFAAIFLGSHFLTKKNATRMMLEHAVSMPDHAWRRLNFAWAYFFIFLGAINLFVAFTFHEYWVDFKVFGSMALIFLFIIGQTVYLLPYIQEEEDKDETVESLDKAEKSSA
ncbi:MAG: septation protein A [Gammaproteobacteria bacterium]|nr:septation protein A [Gammaproteobacteria bacterium]MAY02753.1 septation protein A [Gammaproteobacteria bacterium]|tara:strand:+ start:348 stop:971 length:624 start_codon:yes stop_codon:yes gene_type:complete